jgi:acyl-CoA dehydrogenase
MDFAPSPLARGMHGRLTAFMDRYLLPYNAAWHAAAQAAL